MIYIDKDSLTTGGNIVDQVAETAVIIDKMRSKMAETFGMPEKDFWEMLKYVSDSDKRDEKEPLPDGAMELDIDVVGLLKQLQGEKE